MSEHRGTPRYDLTSMAVTIGAQRCVLVNVSSTGVLIDKADGGQVAINYATPANTWPRLLKVLASRERRNTDE